MIVKVGEGGRVVRLRDIARVELGAQTYNWEVQQFDGAPSIAVAIYQLPGANSLDVANQVRANMKQLARDFPEDSATNRVRPTCRRRGSIAEVRETLSLPWRW